MSRDQGLLWDSLDYATEEIRGDHISKCYIPCVRGSEGQVMFFDKDTYKSTPEISRARTFAGVKDFNPLIESRKGDFARCDSKHIYALNDRLQIVKDEHGWTLSF